MQHCYELWYPIRLQYTANTDATTPNIVGPTMLLRPFARSFTELIGWQAIKLK